MQCGVIKSPKVAEVMEAIDRGLFVPDGNSPYHDSPMQIGYNATISAPHMHATCLELLENHLKPGMHALDVGSGVVHSGFTVFFLSDASSFVLLHIGIFPFFSFFEWSS